MEWKEIGLDRSHGLAPCRRPDGLALLRPATLPSWPAAMLAGQHEKRPGEDLSKRCPSASLGSLLPLPLKPQYSGTLPAHLPGLPSGSGSRASTAFALPTDSVNNPGQHGFGLAQTVPDDGQPRQVCWRCMLTAGIYFGFVNVECYSS